MKKSGFTLIELSIVLVIIGLIIGGVLVGRDLIKAAELRNVMSSIEKYNTAINTFRTKYNCLPGDCASATSYFGTLTDPSWCRDTTNWWNVPSDGSAYAGGTCNGNGDGRLSCANSANGSGCDSAVNTDSYYVFQQLQLANLITPAISADDNIIYGDSGLKSIKSITMLGYYLSAGSSVNYAVWSASQDKHMFILTDATYQHRGPVLRSSEAYSIDKKLDDGKPGSGMIVSGYYVGGPLVAKDTGNAAAGYGECYTNTNPDTSTYILNSDLLACNMAFLTKF